MASVNGALTEMAGFTGTRGGGEVVRRGGATWVVVGAVGQREAQAGVGGDGLGGEGVAGEEVNGQRVVGVEGDGLAGPGGGPADQVIDPATKVHAVVAVAQ